MSDVVVRLEREELERLQTLAATHWEDRLANKLRAALDSPPVEERVEYRVVAEKDDSSVRGFQQLETAEEEKARLEKIGFGPQRIERKQRIDFPWVDLASEEGER